MTRIDNGNLVGKYRAKVEENRRADDGKGAFYARIRLIGLWDELPLEDLPFAEYMLNIGARSGSGDAMPCQVGDLVWVEFPLNGDTRCPLIIGSAYSAPNGADNLPEDLLEPTYKHKRAKGEPTISPAFGDKVVDLFGILQQLTMSGDYAITHKPSGTSISINADGHMVLHSEKDSYRSSSGNTTEQVESDFMLIVKGNTTIKTDGDALVDAKGNATVKCAGDGLVDSKGKLTLKSATEVLLDAPKVGGKAMSYDFK